MAADREGESADYNHGEIEEAVHSGSGFQTAATLLRSQGIPDVDATRERTFLSPRFRSAAAMAGWDEEALLAASLVVEDTPVREFKGKKRGDARLKSPPTTNSRRKRRSRRQTTPPIPPVKLSLDEDETTEDGIHVTVEEKRDTETTSTTADKGKDRGGGSDPAEEATAIPCLDRLREELSCAICLDICFEPSTTLCGHSFCKKCLKCAATKCGRRCPKCRELISNARACTVNTVLWNTIQLLFPAEVEARKKALLPEKATRDRRPRIRSPGRDSSDSTTNRSMGRNNNNNNNNNNNARARISGMRSATRVARLMESDREMMRRMAAPVQSQDAALALRLQREEFMDAFRETQQQPQRSTICLARASLRAMASRAIQQHNNRRRR